MAAMEADGAIVANFDAAGPVETFADQTVAAIRDRVQLCVGVDQVAAWFADARTHFPELGTIAASVSAWRLLPLVRTILADGLTMAHARPILEEIAAAENAALEPGWETVTSERIRARLREPLLENLAGRWHTMKRVTMSRQDEAAFASFGGSLRGEDAEPAGRERRRPCSAKSRSVWAGSGATRPMP